MTIAEKAQLISDHLTDGPRKSEDTGRQIRVLKDGAPDWMQDVIREAHGGMMPDDFRYELIEEAIDTIKDAADEDEARDNLPETPCYNAERLRWLASHLERAGYCDEWIEQGCGMPDGGILNLIACGYRMEQEEVLAQVYRALEQVDVEESIEA